MNPKTLKEILLEWQKRLNLSDWEIEVQVVYLLPGNRAELEVVDPEGKYALLEVSRQCPMEQVEPAILHELLELVFDSAHNIIYLNMSEEDLGRWLGEKKKAIDHLVACLIPLKGNREGEIE